MFLSFGQIAPIFRLRTQSLFILALIMFLPACGGSGESTIIEPPQEVVDSDLDGVPDNIDSFAQDASETGDSDGDQIGDNSDNCPEIVNPLQVDSDLDGTGDLCELADADHDGLLEIETIYQLDMIRNNLKGTALVDNDGNSNSLGCPDETGCFGYELVADINFDTNNNGELDVEDAFYDSNNNKNDGINEGWEPLGDSVTAFSGTFEGNNHQIINFYANQYSGFYMGLFGKAENASFLNIRFSGSLSKVQGSAYIGSLVGQAINSNISQVHSDIEVSTHGWKVGGLAGVLIGSTISDSSYTGFIHTKGSYIGGLIGELDNSTISNSYVIANIVNYDQSEDGTMGTVGGLVGYAENSTIKSSYADGDVQGYMHFGTGPTGGLIARLENSEVVQSYSTGATSGQDETGGLIGSASNSVITLSNASGYISASGAYAGGFAGRVEATVIEDSFSLGRVYSTGSYVGGLIGSTVSSELEQVFSIGHVLLQQPADDANIYWGGLIGGSYSTNISNCYATGNVQGGFGVGGLIGSLHAARAADPLTTSITNCYALGEVSQDTSHSPYGFIYSVAVSSDNHFQISDSYWSSEVSSVSSAIRILSLEGTIETSLIDSTLEALLCPESNNDLDCEGMYNNWIEDIWDFGTSSDYPGLLIEGEVFRPSYNEEQDEYSLFTTD